MKQRLLAIVRNMVLKRVNRLSTLVLMLLLGLGSTALAANNLYCCTDAAGKQVCLRHLAAGMLWPHLSRTGNSGRILRHIEAPLTAEQRA